MSNLGSNNDCSNQQEDAGHVLMMPDYRADNPYQALLADTLETLGVSVVFPKGYKRGLPFLRQLKQVAQPVKVLHFHWYDPYYKGVGRWARLFYAWKIYFDLYCVRMRGVRIVWTVHNDLSHEAKYKKQEQWLRRRIAGLADQIILHSGTSLQNIQEMLAVPSSKIHVIPHGHYRSVYPAAIAKEAARAELGLLDYDKIYLNLGMMRPYKGIENVIQTWSEWKGKSSQDLLLLVGKAQDDAFAQELKDLVEQADNVMWKPEFVPDDAIPVYYSAADVAVLPFNRILTSGSLLLAMSFAKPIIAPRIGNIPEALGAADDLLYAADVAGGLLSSLDKTQTLDLEKLSMKTQQACDALDWETIAEQTKALYCEEK